MNTEHYRKILDEKSYLVEIIDGFTVIFMPSEDVGYDTIILEIDYLKGSGETLEEARSNAIENISSMVYFLINADKLSKVSKEFLKINKKALKKTEAIENRISKYIRDEDLNKPVLNLEL